MQRLRLSSDVAMLHGMVGESLHCFLQLDAGLCLRQDLAHLSDIALEEMLVQGVRNMQSADERECRDVLTAVRDFGKLALKEADV